MKRTHIPFAAAIVALIIMNWLTDRTPPERAYTIGSQHFMMVFLAVVGYFMLYFFMEESDKWKEDE